MLYKGKEWWQFTTPSAFDVILGRTAFPKIINKFPKKKSLINQRSLSTNSPHNGLISALHSLSVIKTFVVSVVTRNHWHHGQKWSGSSSRKRLPYCSGAGHDYPGPRATYSTSWNDHFTATRGDPVRKLRPFIKTIHQGYFPPWNLLAP